MVSSRLSVDCSLTKTDFPVRTALLCTPEQGLHCGTYRCTTLHTPVQSKDQMTVDSRCRCTKNHGQVNLRQKDLLEAQQSSPPAERSQRIIYTCGKISDHWQLIRMLPSCSSPLIQRLCNFHGGHVIGDVIRSSPAPA